MKISKVEIEAVMNPGEWVDLYAITARLGCHPQSAYFGAITKVLNQMISSKQLETKCGNLKTPFYKLVTIAPIIDADQHQRDQGTGHGYAFRFSQRDER